MPSIKRNRANNKGQLVPFPSGVVRVKESMPGDAEIQAALSQVDVLAGSSEEILEVGRCIARAARSDHSVIITGEMGNESGPVAALIHRLSKRSRGPFVNVDAGSNARWLTDEDNENNTCLHCGSMMGWTLTRSLFEQARGGTIFIRDVEQLPRRTQYRLLRFLDDRSRAQSTVSDARVIVSTTKDLTKEIAEDRFITGLYYSLREEYIDLPPLRERRPDIPILINRFLDEIKRQCRLAHRHRIAPEAVNLLSQYDWSGNVRELENAVERLAGAARDDGCITEKHARSELARLESLDKPAAGDESVTKARANGGSRGEAASAPEKITYTIEWRRGESIKDHRRRQYLAFCDRVRELAGFDYSMAAEWLGLERDAFYRRMYRLERQVMDEDDQEDEC